METVSNDAAGAAGFFLRRWQRQVPLGLLFWRDIVLVGTLINLVTSFAALIALGLKAGTLASALIFLAPMPYNIFLVAALWRTADRADPASASTARFGAACWLVLATLV